ncbi:MAG TPA: Fmu (Sun) domain protein, partial [Chitinophagales bacterium]|nr:Fmu (Sun) domain protein [Chitinophagales bacterium]
MSQPHTYPEAFLERLKIILGDSFDAFIESLNGASPTSVRLNPYKPAGVFSNEEPVSWCSNGRYLAERPSFTFDPLFHAGAYYVQEA